MTRKSTPAERLCEAAGVSMREVCRKAGLSERTFRRYVNQGAPRSSADRLCWALKGTCDPMIFVWGYRMWLKIRESRDASSAVGGNADRRQCPVSILTVVPNTE